MLLTGLELARRLESAEGHACTEFARARQRLDPLRTAAWLHISGTFVVFEGIDSPVTQTFGLGLFEDLTPGSLDPIEQFFFERGAPSIHEVSPLAGISTLDLLCDRGYRPIEQSTVLYQTLPSPASGHSDRQISIHPATPPEAGLWTSLSARGWAGDHPELHEAILDFGRLAFARDNTVSFLAAHNGHPGATASLSIHDGVALFAGASTIPEMRHRGLQSALLDSRLRFAASHACDLAMMVTEVGSQSQRNAERAGFRVAYTRTKWRLAPATPRILNP